MIYDNLKDGVWIYPPRKGYKIMCCDCGLVHKIEFKLKVRRVGKVILYRVYRDYRATASARRSNKYK